jgi:hypothetical protein
MSNAIPDLGAQDPELKNSPVAWELAEESDELRESIPGSAVCYFNSMAYAHSTVVKSGTALLRCEHGLWVSAGPSDPDNP